MTDSAFTRLIQNEPMRRRTRWHRRYSCTTESVTKRLLICAFIPLPAPGIVVEAVHGRRGTRAATRVAPDGSPGPPLSVSSIVTRSVRQIVPSDLTACDLVLRPSLVQLPCCIGAWTASHPANHDASCCTPRSGRSACDYMVPRDRVDGVYGFTKWLKVVPGFRRLAGHPDPGPWTLPPPRPERQVNSEAERECLFYYSASVIPQISNRAPMRVSR